MTRFPITRICEDEYGDSHFREMEITLTDNGVMGFLSQPQHVKELIFRTVTEDYDWDFHQAPAKQYVVLLDGAIEIETSTGEHRIFRAGDVLLVEDVSGKGHRTRNVKPAVRKSLFITLH